MVTMENKENKKIYLSASRINSFHNCPGIYYIESIAEKKITQTVWPGNVFGQSVHAVLEKIIEETNNDSKFNLKKTLKQEFKVASERIFEENKKNVKYNRDFNEDEFLKQGAKSCEMLYEYYMANIYNENVEVFSEKKIRGNWILDDNILITSKIDILVKHENDYGILDLKVTKNKEGYMFIDWDRNVQSMIYKFAIHHEYQTFIKYFNYLVIDYINKMLFIKGQKVKTPEHNIEYFREFHNNYIAPILEFHKNEYPEDCYTPSKIGCKWCHNKKCKRKIK